MSSRPALSAVLAIGLTLCGNAAAQVESESPDDISAWGQRYLSIGEPEFPSNLWRYSDDDTLLALMQSVRTADLSPAERRLLRRAVLSPATRPLGTKAEELLAERARLMLELGEERAAADLVPQLEEETLGLDAETLARIDANPNGIGIFGLAFYENNQDKLKVATMGGVAPSTETISTGEYPVSRPLFFYVKKAHIGVIPGLKEFAQFFVADELAGPSGPLANYGLVSDPELAKTQQMVADEKVMGADM